MACAAESAPVLPRSSTDYVSVLQSQDMQHRILEARLRTERGKLVELVRLSGKQNVPYLVGVNVIMKMDCKISELYQSVDMVGLMENNCKVTNDLQKLKSALTILEKYGRNLLKPAGSRPTLWKSVQFANGVFREKVDCIMGSRQILKMMGYSQLVGDALKFPEGHEPNSEIVAMVLAEVILGSYELEMYLKGRHPHPDRLEHHLPLAARVNQEGPTGFSSLSSLTAADIPTVPVAAAAAGRVCLFSQDQWPGAHPLPNVEECKKRILDAQRLDGQPRSGVWASVGKTVNTIPEPSSIALKENTQDASAICDICGDKKAFWKCNICDDKLLCADCDQAWHRHPRRKDHTRQQIYEEPSKTAPVSCDICGDNNGCLGCDSCDKRLCKGCDGKWHGNPHRLNHHRKWVSGGPAASQQVPEGRNDSFASQIASPLGPAGGAIKKRSSEDNKLPAFKELGLNNRLSSEEIQLSSSSTELPNQVKVSPPSSKDVLPAFEDLALTSNEAKTKFRTKSNVTFEDSREEDLDLSVELAGDPEKKTSVDHYKPELMAIPKVADLHTIKDLDQKKSGVLNALQVVQDNIRKIDEAQESLIKLPRPRAKSLIEDLQKQREFQLQEKKKLENFQKLQHQMDQVPRLEMPGERVSEYRQQIKYPPPSFIPPTMLGGLPYPSSPSPHYYGPGTLSYRGEIRSNPQSSPIPPYPPTSPYMFQMPLLPPTTPPVHRGICPNCKSMTNYYAEMCTTCGVKIPDYIRREIAAPPTVSSAYLPSTSYGPLHVSPSFYPNEHPYQQSSPNPNVSSSSPHIRTPSSSSNKSERPLSSSFQGHPVQWECSHCTFINNAGTRVCDICDKTSEKPKLIFEEEKNEKEEEAVKSEPELTEEEIKPLKLEILVAQEQEKAEDIVLMKKKAQEEFRRKQMSESENETASTEPVLQIASSNTAEGIKENKTKLTSESKPLAYKDPPKSHGVKPHVDRSGTPSFGSSGSENETVVVKVPTSKEQIKQLEARKRLYTLEMEGSQMVQVIRQAEMEGFTMKELDLAFSQSEYKNPLNWLQGAWLKLFNETVSKLYGQEGDLRITQMEKKEVCDILADCEGDVNKAVSKYKEAHNSKLSLLMSQSEDMFDENQAAEALKEMHGNIDAAYMMLVRESMKPFLERVWEKKEEPPEEDIYDDILPPDISLRPSTSFADIRALGIIGSESFEERVRDTDLDYETRLRLVLVEGRLQSWGRAEIVLRILDMEGLEGGVTLEDIIEAVRNCGNIFMSLQYLQQECLVCYTKYPASKIKSMGLCQCHICKECMILYLEVNIREKHLRDMKCPVCDQPDMEDMDQREAHFSFLSLMLQNLLEQDLQDLFQKKLCDWALMQDPNFRWCSNCEEGFIFNAAGGQLKMICPHCRTCTCFGCRKLWEPQHENISCEAFQQWKIANDPDHQAVGLARHLEENGIDCPGCKFHYVLAKGGCMHFTCTQCRYEFCSGCSKPFRRSNCQVLRSCQKAGLHCHHPRNCFFYLRDRSIYELQQLIQSKDITYNTDPEGVEAQDLCPVMEQKELVDGFKDEPCGRGVLANQAGLCELHYKEYLVGLINANKIDPIDIMTTDELLNLLKKWEKQFPNRGKQTEQQYRTKLIRIIQNELHLQTLGIRGAV